MRNNRKEREIMLRDHLGARGISDKNVLRSMFKTPRENFISDTLKSMSYEDKSLPIGSGQTISQPYIVALMTMHLNINKDDKILEIGTGCGYQTAILANYDCSITTIERVESLYKEAIYNLQTCNLQGEVTHILGDGTIGAIKHAPFDKIIVTAGAPGIVKSLLRQLNNNGILIIPEGNRDRQILKRYTRKENKITVKDISYCNFVPLIGEDGWDN